MILTLAYLLCRHRETQRLSLQPHSLSTELDYLREHVHHGAGRGLEITEGQQHTFGHEYRNETALTFHQLSQEHGGNLVKLYSFSLSGMACVIRSKPAYSVCEKYLLIV